MNGIRSVSEIMVDLSIESTRTIRNWILAYQNKEITLARMEVPCCGGLQNALITALKNSGKMIPWQVKVISCDGRLLD